MYESNPAIRAANQMNTEVEEEAVRLIQERGMSLWEAMEQARKNVQNKRRYKSQGE